MIITVVSKDKLTITWWIVYNEDKSIVNYGVTDPPQETQTGLPLNQVFDDEASWLLVLKNEFNIVPE
jgi:hypothetical protein